MAENEIPVSADAHRENVREIQQYLRDISLYNPQVRTIIPDGIYGDKTRLAVSDFQRSYGLPVTSEVDRQTWEYIYIVYVDIIENLSKQEGIMPFPSLDSVLSTNDSGIVVLILQAMLNTLAGLYFNITPNQLNGVYDSDTANAVAEIQAAAGITPTGVTDIRTWNIIVKAFNAEAEDG